MKETKKTTNMAEMNGSKKTNSKIPSNHGPKEVQSFRETIRNGGKQPTNTVKPQARIKKEKDKPGTVNCPAATRG